MKGIHRQVGVAPRNRKAGLSTADVRAIVTSIDGTRPIDHRDRALILLGYATALRRSELVALTVEGIEDHPEGVIVHKRRSNTDQESSGERIEVAYGEHPYTCPVRAYRAWLDESLIGAGPIFRPINRHGTLADQALAAKAAAAVIKKHVARLGYDPGDYAGHSLRRGFSTQAARNGASERTIARTTHHTSTKGLQPYIEDAELFTDPASRYLGL
ncbi:MAG: site-specific integrase [Acidimicrobiales bacterium]